MIVSSQPFKISGALVTLTHGPSGDGNSCSGVYLHAPGNDYILTHGSLLTMSLPLEEPPKALVKALKPGKMCYVTKENNIFSFADSSYEITVTLSETESYEAEIVAAFRSLNYFRALATLFSASRGWSFAGIESKTEKEEPDEQTERYVRFLLPLFLVVRLKRKDVCVSDDKIQRAISLFFAQLYSVTASMPRRGLSVVVEGTPFGLLAPKLFLNSLSNGIISAVAGPSGIALLCDASAAPGCEGAPLLSKNGEFVGMVIAPLSWRCGEWVGFTFAISGIGLIAEMIADLPVLPRKLLSDVALQKKLLALPSEIQDVITSVVLVKCGTSWGSGVIWPNNTGDTYILTCSHVVTQSKSAVTKPITVIAAPNVKQKSAAELVFRSPDGKAFDVAVLRIAGQMWFSRWTVSDKLPEKGEKVFLMGHALHDESCQMFAKLSQGIVSGVKSVEKIPVVLQTTCCAQCGVSGGAVFRPDGELLGIAACTAKDRRSGAVFPRLNLVVPIHAIKPIMDRFFYSNCDEAVLNELHANKAIQQIWHMSTQKSKLQSRL